MNTYLFFASLMDNQGSKEAFEFQFLLKMGLPIYRRIGKKAWLETIQRYFS